MHLVGEDALEENGEIVTLPVEESAAGRFPHILLPVGDHIDLPSAILKALLSLGFQDILKNQALAVVDDCLAQEIVATTKSCGDGIHEILHPGVHRLLKLLLPKILKSQAKDVCDFSGDVAVYHHYPLVDDVLLGLELNLNSFEHFHALEDVLQALIGQRSTRGLLDHNLGFNCPLYLRGKVDTYHYKVSTSL